MMTLSNFLKSTNNYRNSNFIMIVGSVRKIFSPKAKAGISNTRKFQKSTNFSKYGRSFD